MTCLWNLSHPCLFVPYILNTPDNLRRWDKKEFTNCSLFGNHCTLLHILNYCSISLNQWRFDWRHNSVLKVLTSTLLEGKPEDLYLYSDLVGYIYISKVSKKYPKRIQKASKKYQTVSKKISKKYPKSIQKLSQKYYQSILKVSIKYPKSIQKYLKKYPKIVPSIQKVSKQYPKQYQKSTPEVSQKFPKLCLKYHLWLPTCHKAKHNIVRFRVKDIWKIPV